MDVLSLLLKPFDIIVKFSGHYGVAKSLDLLRNKLRSCQRSLRIKM